MPLHALLSTFLPRMHLALNHQVAPGLRHHRLPTPRLFRFRRFRRFLFAGLLFGLFAPLVSPAFSAPSPAPATLSSNRFLIAFDISSPMHRQTAAVQKSVQNVLESNASGQLHFGDTIGVWSFDADVHAGFFPLQVWASGEEQEIALRIAEFLKQQPNGKRSRLNKLIVGMSDLINNSDILTIIIFSTGDSPMKGTPFDQEINDTYQTILKDMKRDRMPIVTVLQAKHGKLVKYTVNALPWPVVIPELPIALKVPKTAPAMATAPATPIAKTNTVIAAAPAIPQTPAPAPAKTPVVVAAIPVVPQAPTPAPTQSPVAAVSAPAPMAVPAPAAATPAPVAVPTPTPVPPATPAPVPGIAQSQVNPGIATSDYHRVESVPIPPLTPKAQPPTTAPIVKSTPPPVTNAEVTHASAPTELQQPSTNSPAIPAVAVLPTSGPRSKTLLAAAATFMLFAIVLLIIIIRRARASGPSLITSSMNNPRK